MPLLTLDLEEDTTNLTLLLEELEYYHLEKACDYVDTRLKALKYWKKVSNMFGARTLESH